jgi:hypothetical protein
MVTGSVVGEKNANNNVNIMLTSIYINIELSIQMVSKNAQISERFLM